MRRFDNTKLWDILTAHEKPPASLADGVDGILDEFVEDLHTYCRREKNIAERTRSLNYARSRFAEHLESTRWEAKKNAPIRSLIKQAVSFIDSELGLIKSDLEHPERFLEFPEDNPPLARWKGNVNDLIEYFIGPQVSGRLLKPSGEPMAYSDAIKFIEAVFGITISGAYDRKTKILGRQKNTSFQDEMRQAFLQEAKKIDK